jgi:hypothetical protein
MMGRQTVDQSQLFYLFNLERRIPARHLLRRINPTVTRILAEFREKLEPFYSEVGRPSIDPELMIRMLIVGYCYGIRFERKLCEEVELHLAYRWFCRLDLDDKVPDHSSRLGREPGGGFVSMPDAFTGAHRAPIISLAARNNVPAIYQGSIFVRDGGLLSYGTELRDLYYRAAAYVDRILRGAKPADLPVQLPVKFEMAVNLKTAKALGLTIPETLLATADEVIK